MRTPLDKALRGKLEKTVEKARDIVEIAVAEALTRLGISDGSAPSYLSDEERKLRNRLRAHGRQLGDALNKESGKQETELLINEMSYEHWHRMLFARFLEQSDLLMYDQNTHVTLDECFELAEEEVDITDGWELAGQLAQKMLPQIFRTDSPVFEVKLSINHVNTLEDLIAKLHEDTFQASDALGWCYQFWQNKKKKQVNESGVKIGAKELSPVTQLFTEPYMVSFLLDNALGAWWAKRRLTQDDLATATSEQELRELASIPGVPLEYLRFVKDEESGMWKSAAGDFDKWPDDLSEFKTLDPCCGSGHFLVAKFLMLVPIRMELEGLSAKESIDKVLAQNIHGLELDQRCVELAAFALALEAWRYPGAGGYRQLPELHLACSGMSIAEAQKEWKDLAKDDEELQGAVKWMQQTFKDAPTLGSLIEPTKSIENLENAPWERLQRAIAEKSGVSNETKAVAQGLAKASGLLSEKYEWVITNVPYLVRGKQSDKLKKYCETYYPDAKNDLATVFLKHCLSLCELDGFSSIVLPQNWLFLSSYTKFRENLFRSITWNQVARLGSGAFETISGEVVKAILIGLTNRSPNELDSTFHVDISEEIGIDHKRLGLQKLVVGVTSQYQQLDNPDARFAFQEISSLPLLVDTAYPYKGITSGDDNIYRRYFFEADKLNLGYEWLQSTVKDHIKFGGCQYIIAMDKMINPIKPGVYIRAAEAKGKKGVSISLMGKLSSSQYLGTAFDTNISSIVVKDDDNLGAITAFCESQEYYDSVRVLDQKLNVTNATLGKVPFDLPYWKSVATNKYPNGLPKPYTNDPTQWIFHGHPCSSVVWNEETKTTAISDLLQGDTVLQVAVARLLGYRWPAELDTEMELAPEMREVIAQNKAFDGLVDDDGIVCIPAIRGEKPADDRLEAILHAAYSDKWSATVLNNLLKSVKSRDLNIWLRDKFFEQHCKLFQHRPFIWHIWDGLPDGFSALVNYHQLDYKGLERLIYTYLDDWISTQIQLEKDEVEGAELRLSAAQNLKESLETILVGESNGGSLPERKGLDIFVRWKSLAEQPIGWNPDLNDGVRLNIRPFMQAKDVGKKEAGVLRFKPNIHWKKDRGTDVESAPWYDLGLEYGGNKGDRINDHHLTLAEKKAARKLEEKNKEIESV
jgi:hypothetical protein